jgi:Flp pilus assembly pilin Flp
MWLHLLPFWSEPAVAADVPEQPPTPPPPRARRKGVTAMEYLVVISFILTVVILTVQHLGGVTQGLFKNSGDATKKTTQGNNQ